AEWRALYGLLRGPEPEPGLVDLIKSLCDGVEPGGAVLLPIDQIEELFTIAQDDERSAFVRVITALLNPERDLPVLAVATLRADMLRSVLVASDLAQLVEPVPLLPIPMARVAHLVEGPAVVTGLSVESGLAERMAHDMESPESLPLFAYTLRLLY